MSIEDVKTIVAVAAIVAFMVGFWVGRRVGEHQRGRYEAQGAWDRRNEYRRNDG